MSKPELYQFNFSHFNEKARWALDYKGVDHRRNSLLPGPHVPIMLALTGQTATPALKVTDQVITGSAQIIDYLEKTYPDPPLYPEDPDERKDALELQAWFDEKVGPAVRQALFFDILVDPIYVSRVFTSGNPLARFFYFTGYPFLATFLSVFEKITPARAEAGRETTLEALNFIAANAGRDGYLIGNRFSVADLTAAALLFLTALPSEAHIPAFHPVSASAKKWLARWEGHPGTVWIRTMYQRHRLAGAEGTAAHA